MPEPPIFDISGSSSRQIQAPTPTRRPSRPPTTHRPPRPPRPLTTHRPRPPTSRLPRRSPRFSRSSPCRTTRRRPPPPPPPRSPITTRPRRSTTPCPHLHPPTPNLKKI